MSKDRLFIYNHILADWLIKNGATVIGAGKNRANGDTYIVFKNDEIISKLLLQWNPGHKSK